MAATVIRGRSGVGASAGRELHSQSALQAVGSSQTIVIDDSHSKGARREHAAQFTAGAIRADRWDLRALSTSLSLPYVAAGRVAAYVLFWTSAVHAAAGSLLALEAGATLSDIDGRPWTIDSDSILASARLEIHRDLLELSREAWALAVKKKVSPRA